MEKNIIEFAFGLLNQIKLHHWATKSYATHKALDQLHEDLSKLVDTLVETYIGNQERQPIEKFTVSTVSHSGTDDILPFLKQSYVQIKTLRKSFKQTELQNTADEMSSAINQAIYLLNLT